MIELGTCAPGCHAYAVEVERAPAVLVFAKNRTQAAAIAYKAGYEVRSVNMVG